eukprot:m.140166 g.140166  ORF g.140166 m.140166 type:complete len:144 (-) comp16104_c0_seq2:2756-3187(-)
MTMRVFFLTSLLWLCIDGKKKTSAVGDAKYPHTLIPDGFSLRNSFKLHDRNLDGYLDKEEGRYLYESDFLSDRMIDREVDTVWRAIDKDSDDRMSFDEFAKFFNLAVGQGSLLPELEGNSATGKSSKTKKARKKAKPSRHTEM